MGFTLRGTFRKKLFILAAVMGSCILSACMLELCSYIYFKSIKNYSNRHTLNGYELDAFRNYRHVSNYTTKTHTFNEHGFRRKTPVSRQKPKGIFRIFLLGGSTAFGSDANDGFPSLVLDDTQTISHFLEEQLNQSDHSQKYEVINAAVSGYQSHNHFVYLNQKLLDFDPDMVLFLDGHNDYYHIDPNHYQFSIVDRHVEEINDATLSSTFEMNIRYLAKKSWFFYGVLKYLNRVKTWRNDYGKRGKGDLTKYREISLRVIIRLDSVTIGK
jgi:hypothetical protein